MSEEKPNPGSPKASHLGCTCPVVDNHYGHGINDDGKTFWINADCPLHGVAADDEQDNEQ